MTEGKIKISNEKSMFTKPKTPDASEFKLAADEYMDERTLRTIKIKKSTEQFKKLLELKTLRENKSLADESIESDIISHLIQIGMDLNSDDNEAEAQGAMGLITLLLKTSLSQRDRINKLEYNLKELQKKIVAQK